MVDDGSQPVSGRLLQPGVSLTSADIRAAPDALAGATHCLMSPVCHPRRLSRAIMEAASRAQALRCLTTHRRPIELRQLNGTGFSLMCSVTNSPPVFTRSTPLFVYAKARTVTLRSVWPSNLPECDRSDIAEATKARLRRERREARDA